MDGKAEAEIKTALAKHYLCVLLVWVHELVYWLGSVSRIRVFEDHFDLCLFGIIFTVK